MAVAKMVVWFGCKHSRRIHGSIIYYVPAQLFLLFGPGCGSDIVHLRLCHDFNHGALFGPIDICFRVSNTNPPFILHWTPDVGAFCCQKDITIWPT